MNRHLSPQLKFEPMPPQMAYLLVITLLSALVCLGVLVNTLVEGDNPMGLVIGVGGLVGMGFLTRRLIRKCSRYQIRRFLFAVMLLLGSLTALISGFLTLQATFFDTNIDQFSEHLMAFVIFLIALGFVAWAAFNWPNWPYDVLFVRVIGPRTPHKLKTDELINSYGERDKHNSYALLDRLEQFIEKLTLRCDVGNPLRTERQESTSREASLLYDYLYDKRSTVMAPDHPLTVATLIKRATVRAAVIGTGLSDALDDYRTARDILSRGIPYHLQSKDLLEFEENIEDTYTATYRQLFYFLLIFETLHKYLTETLDECDNALAPLSDEQKAQHWAILAREATFYGNTEFAALATSKTKR